MLQRMIKKYRSPVEAYEKFCKQMGEKPADVASGLAAGEPGRDRADHRSAHDGAVDGQPACAQDQTQQEQTWKNWTRSGPVPAAKRLRRLPGNCVDNIQWRVLSCEGVSNAPARLSVQIDTLSVPRNSAELSTQVIGKVDRNARITISRQAGWRKNTGSR